MNESQHFKYRVCAGQAVRAMRRFGHKGATKDLTAKLRRQALGYDKESRALNNNEFDKVLAVFAGWHSMTDLEEQLRLMEQPLKRILFAATKMLDELDIKEHGREVYLASIYNRVQGSRSKNDEQVYSLEEIPDEDFPLVLGALNHTLEHKKNPKRKPRYYRKPKRSAARREQASEPPVPTTGEIPF